MLTRLAVTGRTGAEEGAADGAGCDEEDATGRGGAGDEGRGGEATVWSDAGWLEEGKGSLGGKVGAE